MSSIRVPVSGSSCSTHDSAPDQPQILFTRQLWQRTMPSDTDQAHPSRGQRVSIGGSTIGKTSNASARTISTSSLHSPKPGSPTISHRSDTPPTPGDSPSHRSGRKRSADHLEEVEEEVTPSHSRESSDSAFQPCFCQPEPKVPRPRNGTLLILYSPSSSPWAGLVNDRQIHSMSSKSG